MLEATIYNPDFWKHLSIPFVAGVSAASGLAAELGAELGLTVVGFLRDDGANVYSGRHRIVPGRPAVASTQ